MEPQDNIMDLDRKNNSNTLASIQTMASCAEKPPRDLSPPLPKRMLNFEQNELKKVTSPMLR